MTPAPSTNEGLLRGLRGGEPDAFEHLYSQYHASIYNLCARILGDREEAQDLTQDVFIKAYRQLPAEQRELRLRPWLFKVAANTCYDHLRSRGRAGGPASEVGPALDEVAAPVNEFDRSYDVAVIEGTLGAINERYRTAIVLKDLHGLPPDEIAEVLDVSRGTADVLVHRARAAFRRAYAAVAGEATPAPANLGLALGSLSVPAGLQIAPALPVFAPPAAPGHPVPTPAHPAATPHQAVPGSVAPDLSSAAGPVGAGVLAKLGAALTTKAAITAAVVATVAGGSLAVGELRSRSDARVPAPAGSAAAAVSVFAGSRHVDATHHSRTGHGPAPGHGHHRGGGHGNGSTHDGATAHSAASGSTEGTHATDTTHETTTTAPHADSTTTQDPTTTTHTDGGQTTAHDTSEPGDDR